MSKTTRKLFDFFVKWHPIIFLSIPILFLILGLFKFEIGKEAYFYTLSTVAQSLAALIGMIGVFIIFKLDKLKSQRKDSLIHLEKKITEYFPIEKFSYAPPTPYFRLIDLVNTDSEDDIFHKIAPILKEINEIDEIDVSSQPREFRNFIEELNNRVNYIKEIDEKDKKIRMNFFQPALFGLIAIVISIIILPFGWIVTSVEIILPFYLLKMFLVGTIIYFALLSIFELFLLLEWILGVKFAGIIEEKGIKIFFKWS